MVLEIGKGTLAISTQTLPNARGCTVEVLKKFPGVTQIWTYATFPDHSNRRCTDFMVYNDRALGDQIARYHTDNWRRMGVEIVIWYGRIWRSYTKSDGPNPSKAFQWATYRGPSAHKDHPHVQYNALSYEPPKPVAFLPPYVVDPEKVSTQMWAVHEDKDDLLRDPGFVIDTGVEVVTWGGRKRLKTQAGYMYALELLVLQSELAKRPAAPKDPLPVEETPTVPPKQYVTNGLSLTKPKALKVRTTLNAPGGGNWQGATQDPSTGDWFIAEARKTTDGREDCDFHRFNAGGQYIDSMTAKAGPGQALHPTGWAVDNSSDIYLTWNVPGSGKSGLVKFPYKGGSVVERKDTIAVAPSLPGNCQIALSPSRKYAVVRRVRADADEFTKYRLSDLMADKPKALGKTVSVPRSPDRVMQGFTLEDDLLFCLTGYAHTLKVLEKYDLATGKPIANFDLSDIEGEPEGLDWNTVGLKQGKGEDRRLVLYAHNL